QKYQWKYANNLGNGNIDSGKINPRIILDIEQFNKLFTSIAEQDKFDFYIVLKDIECDANVSPQSAIQTFHGKLFGQNMEIENLYLNANTSELKNNSYYGLFASLQGETEKAVVKDLTISTRLVVANNVAAVGVLAGRIDNSYVSNISIDGTSVVIQGKYFVGGLAGIINNSTVTDIEVTASINAIYRSDDEKINNYKTTDLKYFGLANEDVTEEARENFNKYTYSGVSVGVLTGNSTLNYVKVSGDNKVIGYFASACVGLVDAGSTLSNAIVTLNAQQYVRGYAIAGGLVAENRGTIDMSYIQHEQTTQISIDKTNTTAGRNLTFFAGTPKVIGGFVGFNNGGTITNSYSKLDVRTNNAGTYIAGGFVGTTVGGTITSCYATGSVLSKYTLGGFIGSITNKEYIQITEENKEKTTSSILDTMAYVYSNIQVVDGVQKDMAYCPTISKCFAANRWLSVKESNALYFDYEMIELFSISKGLFIGVINCEKDKENETLNNITLANNYVATQTNSNETTSNIIKGFANSESAVLTQLKGLLLGRFSADFSGTITGNNDMVLTNVEYQHNNTKLNFNNINNIDNIVADMFASLYKDESGII
ncbi:MAG: hypothetical protein IJX26_04455, partial [Clostridia bacterium]|nr:hypothetical protein [Clostridia bacterium]